MATTKIITKDNRAVAITEQDGKVWAYLYTNARYGFEKATCTTQRWTGKTVQGAERWAAKRLA